MDQSFNPLTQRETVILRGIENCQEINVPNRRVHCCYTDHCNKHRLPMSINPTIDVSGGTNDLKSNCYLNLSSTILACLTIIMKYIN